MILKVEGPKIEISKEALSDIDLSKGWKRKNRKSR